MCGIVVDASQNISPLILIKLHCVSINFVKNKISILKDSWYKITVNFFFKNIVHND